MALISATAREKIFPNDIVSLVNDGAYVRRCSSNTVNHLKRKVEWVAINPAEKGEEVWLVNPTHEFRIELRSMDGPSKGY